MSGGVGGGSAASLRSSALVVASSSGFVPLSGSADGSVSSASLRSASAGGGRVGVGFGARVCDWGARVGVGGGVVSGGGVVARLWAGVVGCVRALVSGVGAWGLVLAGLVGVAKVGECARVGGVVWASRSWRVGCIARICCFGRGVPGVFCVGARVNATELRVRFWFCA